MSLSYQCPRGHRGRFVRIKPVVRYEPRTFLWWSWVAEIVDGYLARCVHHGCGRVWVVTLDGVHEPAEVAPQPAPAAVQTAEEEREHAPPPPPLGLAVRRPRVGA